MLITCEGNLFTSEKNGTLKTSRVKLEKYLEETHTDAKRHEPMSIPSDIPPINPPEYQMDVCAPMWKEIEQVMRKERASSSLGPNGVPYRVYKSVSGVLQILWKLIKVAWEKTGCTLCHDTQGTEDKICRCLL